MTARRAAPEGRREPLQEGHPDLLRDVLHGECPATPENVKTCCMACCTVKVQPCPKSVKNCRVKTSGTDVKSNCMNVHQTYVETCCTKVAWTNAPESVETCCLTRCMVNVQTRLKSVKTCCMTRCTVKVQPGQTSRASA